MKKKTPPGILYVMKEYHSVMSIVLEERGQTHADAAKDLGISVATFGKILRLKSFPNFHTERGKVLAQRFERWSTLTAVELFPEAFYTKEFLKAPKTHKKTLPFRLLARGRKDEDFALSFSMASQPPKSHTKKSGSAER